MAADVVDVIYRLRDMAGAAADTLRPAIAEAQAVLDKLEAFADGAEHAAQLQVYGQLIKALHRKRGLFPGPHGDGDIETFQLLNQAADAVEAQGRRIEELDAENEKLTKALGRIVDVANFSAIDGVDGFVWRYDMPPGPIHAAIKVLNESGHPVESVGRVRLNPEVRADLIEYARARIQMVWDDAGEIDAMTLAQNVVAAQEWLWLSLHFPVAVVVEGK